MKKLLATVAVMGLATSAQAATKYATVIGVQPNYHSVFMNVPQQQCQNVEVPIYGTVQGGGNAVEGAVGGAIIGGILGQALGGDKDSRNAGAIFGAIVGGDKAANGTRQVVTGYKTERQCSEVIVRQEQRQIKNYSITYRWNGVTGQSYTYNQYSVGDRIPVTVSINAN
jgi:uncharacterized protein YcfJ